MGNRHKADPVLGIDRVERKTSRSFHGLHTGAVKAVPIRKIGAFIGSAGARGGTHCLFGPLGLLGSIATAVDVAILIELGGGDDAARGIRVTHRQRCAAVDVIVGRLRCVAVVVIPVRSAVIGLETGAEVDI